MSYDHSSPSDRADMEPDDEDPWWHEDGPGEDEDEDEDE